MKKNKCSSDTEKKFEEECPPVWRTVHFQNLVKKFPFMEPLYGGISKWIQR
jgi:hypothetical protein